MSGLIRTVFLFFLVLLAPASMAGDEVRPEVPPAVLSDADNAHLKELLATLESDSAREEFITNLKALIELRKNNVAAPPEGEVITISRKLGLEEQTESLMSRYKAFLSRYNLSKSTVGSAGLSVLALLVYFILILIYRRLVHAIENKLDVVRIRYGVAHQRFALYVRAIRLIGTVLLALLFIYTLNVIWALANVASLLNQATAYFMSEIINIVAVVGLGLLLYEIANGFMEYTIKKANRGTSNRVKTLLPILRNVVIMVFTIFFTLVVLSELGIDIMPLLAGAGIVGIAIGFGAQTMVKDFLTGFTIILEDLIQVGDVASVGGCTGLVERITIRKVQLRDFSGKVYTVPFSEIAIVENLSKDFSCYVFDIGVAYRENVEEVIALLRECDEELRSREPFKTSVLMPLEVFGIDQFADSAVIIKARYQTRPLKQWDVGREFNRLMKIKFDAHNIEIPFPHQTVYFGEDRQGNSPSAHVQLNRAGT